MKTRRVTITIHEGHDLIYGRAIDVEMKFNPATQKWDATSGDRSATHEDSITAAILLTTPPEA